MQITSMITTRQIYLAYRKLKGQCYYDSLGHKMKYAISQWEADLVGDNFECDGAAFERMFSDKVRQLEEFLNIDVNWRGNRYFNELLDKVSFQFELKKFAKDKKNRSSDGRFITNQQAEPSAKLEKCNYMIDAPIEVYLISTLWVMCLNRYLNGKLNKYNYANRVRRDTDCEPVVGDNPKGIELGITQVYFYNYQKWRDNALDKATKILEKKHKNASIFSMDIERFFYSARVNILNVLADNQSRGYLRDEYMGDSTLMRLSEIVQVINEQYSSILSDYIVELGLPEIRQGEAILPVGLPSSSILGNLYLTRFDDVASQLEGCEYYGRYVDDMLFVFSGKIDNRSEDPVKTFVTSKFTRLGLLQPDGVNYKIKDYENLRIQKEKLILESFSANGPLAALKLFKKKLKENNSDFRFFLDEDEADEGFENAAYSLEYSDSVNKIRSIEAFKEDKYGASKYLARKISLACVVTPDSKEVKVADKSVAQIVNFFRGKRNLDFSSLWEKVATYLVVTESRKALCDFVKGTLADIDRIKSSKDAKGFDLQRVKDDVKENFYIALAMPFALAPSRLEMLNGVEGLDTNRIGDIAASIRRANMLRHIRIGLGAVNYTHLLYSDKDLYQGFEHYKDLRYVSCNIQWWLSPRFVSMWEIFSLMFRYQLNVFQEEEGLDPILEKANILFSSLNYQWMSLFGGAAVNPASLFVSSSNLEENPVVEIDFLEDDNVLEKWKLNGIDKKVGIVNKKVLSSDYKRALNNKKSKLSKGRKEELYRILDDAQQKSHRCDILALPELALPVDWMDMLAYQARSKDLAVISGLEYFECQGFVINVVLTILPVRLASNYKDCILIPRLKNHYAPAEVSGWKKKGYKIPSVPKRYHLFHWRHVYFSVYNCFELASIEDRSLMKSKVDFIIATEWNKDVSYYADIVGSWARDLHCYVVQVNTSEFGDSCILQPSDSVHHIMLAAKGGETSVVMLDTLLINQLRQAQIAYTPKLKLNNEAEVKPLPPDFNLTDVDKRIKDESFYVQ